jgi:hypothetical protein
MSSCLRLATAEVGVSDGATAALLALRWSAVSAPVCWCGAFEGENKAGDSATVPCATAATTSSLQWSAAAARFRQRVITALSLPIGKQELEKKIRKREKVRGI